MKKCEQHKGDQPLQNGEQPYCPMCGRLIDTKVCESCKRTFYDWDSTAIDDVIAPPSSYNGDFMCQPCASQAFEREEQRDYDEDYPYEDLPPEAYAMPVNESEAL